MRVKWVLWIGAASVWGCDGKEETSDRLQPAELRVFAFPSTVEPRGQATIAVEVALGTCKEAEPCTVCVGMPTSDGSGRLYGPPGLAAMGGATISLPFDATALLQSLTYVAPALESSEVVSVAAYQGSIDCTQSQSLDTLLATSTVRITTRKVSPTTDTPSNGGAGGEGGGDAGPSPGDAGPSPGGAGPIPGDGGT